jgi:hypothetical protein
LDTCKARVAPTCYIYTRSVFLNRGSVDVLQGFREI